MSRTRRDSKGSVRERLWRCDISVCVVYAKMGAKNVGMGKESENSDDLKPVKSGQGGRSAFDFIKERGWRSAVEMVRWRRE